MGRSVRTSTVSHVVVNPLSTDDAPDSPPLPLRPSLPLRVPLPLPEVRAALGDEPRRVEKTRRRGQYLSAQLALFVAVAQVVMQVTDMTIHLAISRLHRVRLGASIALGILSLLSAVCAAIGVVLPPSANLHDDWGITMQSCGIVAVGSGTVLYVVLAATFLGQQTEEQAIGAFAPLTLLLVALQLGAMGAALWLRLRHDYDEDAARGKGYWFRWRAPSAPPVRAAEVQGIAMTTMVLQLERGEAEATAPPGPGPAQTQAQGQMQERKRPPAQRGAPASLLEQRASSGLGSELSPPSGGDLTQELPPEEDPPPHVQSDGEGFDFDPPPPLDSPVLTPRSTITI